MDLLREMVVVLQLLGLQHGPRQRADAPSIGQPALDVDSLKGLQHHMAVRGLISPTLSERLACADISQIT